MVEFHKAGIQKQSMAQMMNCDTLGSGKFLIKVTGDSMSAVGIDEGDSLLIDVAEIPKNGDIAVIRISGCFLVKRVFYRGCGVILVSETNDSNIQYDPIQIDNVAKIDLLAKVISSVKKVI